MSETITIGMDLGDKYNIAVVFDKKGSEAEVARLKNTKAGITKFFDGYRGGDGGHRSGNAFPVDQPFAGRDGLSRFCR